MAEIPGKDNYGANLTDDSFGNLMYETEPGDLKVLNTGVYHRWFKLGQKGAMGLTVSLPQVVQAGTGNSHGTHGKTV